MMCQYSKAVVGFSELPFDLEKNWLNAKHTFDAQLIARMVHSWFLFDLMYKSNDYFTKFRPECPCTQFRRDKPGHHRMRSTRNEQIQS
jgi:hypothetical protein